MIEPDSERQESLRDLLQNHGYAVECRAGISTETIAAQVILCPAELAEEKVQLLNFKERPTILFSQTADIRKAVASIREGAADYLIYPFLPDELIAAVERALEATVRHETLSITDQSAFYPMLGRCEPMLALFKHINKVAPTDSTVLIRGESGTGKELVARAIHILSARENAPLISLNCAAIPDTLIESELFGHERGAFTGATTTRSGLIESADNGTLFLDEIGELPVEAQARLLRVLQEGEIRRVGSTKTRKVNIRLIAATHRDLKALTGTGQFREDLYYRLNVVALTAPPLRERGEDIADLANYFLDKICKTLNRPLMSLSSEALNLISTYHWPGNVRELENAIERAVILCDHNVIEAEALAIDHHLSLVKPKTQAPLTEAKTSQTSLEDYFVAFVLEHQDQNTETELAHKLGISRKSLWERRQRLGIPRTKTHRKAIRRD